MNSNESPAWQRVAEIIADSTWHMDILRAVRNLGLTDCMVGAGFVRNAVWDHLHGFKRLTPLVDIDVVYFDPHRPDLERDDDWEQRLKTVIPNENWSVRNQARMHHRNGDAPYSSTEDAIRHWLETPTCIAVWLDDRDRVSVIAPHGVDDLLDLRVRPTPSGIRKPDQYRNRIDGKNWVSNWPRLIIEYPEQPRDRV